MKQQFHKMQKPLFHTVKFWLSTEAGDVRGLILAYSAWLSLGFALHVGKMPDVFLTSLDFYADDKLYSLACRRLC